MDHTAFAIFTLLVAFQVKHLLVDYFWQSDWMLNKFKPDWSFFWPLAAHSGLHGWATCVIVVAFRGNPLLGLALGALDCAAHFAMDRIKAAPKYLGRFKPLYGSDWLECKRMDLHPGSFLDEHVAASRAALRSNRWFWRCLGIDQAFHHLTHYAVVAVMVLQ